MCFVLLLILAQCSSPTCKNLITQAKVFIDKLNQNPAALMCQLIIFKVLLEKNTHTKYYYNGAMTIIMI